MGELDLDELERLAKAATPGPWEWWTSNSFLRLSGPDGRDGGVLYACNIRNEYATVVVSEADRHFIAEARTALPALIARIRELEQDAARYRWLRSRPFAVKRPLCERGIHFSFALQDADRKWLIHSVRGEVMDAAIDAARKEKGHE